MWSWDGGINWDQKRVEDQECKTCCNDDGDENGDDDDWLIPTCPCSGPGKCLSRSHLLKGDTMVGGDGVDKEMDAKKVTFVETEDNSETKKTPAPKAEKPRTKPKEASP